MSATTTPPDLRVRELLRDAAYWRALGRLFECPGPEWRADIETLAREVNERGLSAAVAAALAESSEGQYHSVFGPGGPAPPREVSYHDTLELGSVMSSIAAYYESFAYTVTLAESPDHIAVEAGFMAYMRLKEAYALVDGEAERATIVRSAADAFRADHLAMSVPRLAEILAHSPLDYLQQASRLLADRVGARPGPKRLTVLNAPFDDDESDFPCSEHQAG